MNLQRVQRAGQLGMTKAIRAGDETVEEITRKTLHDAGPAIADELIKDLKIIGLSHQIEDIIRWRLGEL